MSGFGNLDDKNEGQADDGGLACDVSEVSEGSIGAVSMIFELGIIGSEMDASPGPLDACQLGLKNKMVLIAETKSSGKGFLRVSTQTPWFSGG